MERKLRDLHGKNIVVFDCEIKNVIDGKSVTWKDHDKMGISVACLFDYRTGDTHAYLDDNIAELAARLHDADLIVGFNIVAFDNMLLAATLQMPVELRKMIDVKCYDLLTEVRRSTGQQFPKACTLNHVLEATFGMQKTADGAQAPLMFQRGEMGTLISYCLADVRRERILFEEAYLKGEVKTEMHGVHKMRNPLE